MKHLTTIILLFTVVNLSLFGQIKSGCEEWTENHYDKVTGDYTLRSKQTIIVKNDSTKDAFEIAMFKTDKNGILIIIKLSGGKSCIDKFSKINILFDDQTRLEVYNCENYNCDALVGIGLGNSAPVIIGGNDKWEDFKLLSSKKIETLRVWTGNTYVQNDFSELNKREFINTLNCLIDSKMRSKINYSTNDDVYY